MASIGIIANPASGKDIRRLVSHATVIDNNEKINIVERIVLGAQALGVEKVYVMPDSYNMGYRVEDKLNSCNELRCEINVINMMRFDGMEDTVKAADYMEKNDDIKCIIILGGDGTNRAAAKSIKNTPIITISTGTNNVYPTMLEGTVAGMAAAAVASDRFDAGRYVLKDKRIEIYKDDNLIDIALIDAVISKDVFIGSRAIWNIDSIEKIFVTRAHPASIGFSSLVGCKKIIYPEDDFGAYVDINSGREKIKAPVAAGVVEPVSVSEPVILGFGDEYEFTANDRGTIALDGEREIEFKKDQKLVFKITREGPYHVDVIKVLETAQESNFFTIEN
ncbi:MAG TPA: NAD(+)/NADH kinase [Sedimentibacter sp.]|nr:NAD(+)/NADH kinase [Sedimentibacter sp.]HOW22254.1 NAD(+)/NADH kinase [Sedimentibacter sp.]HRC80396.1 NAD(+)/NADH kinase [Sedimentibacter sp.]